MRTGRFFVALSLAAALAAAFAPAVRADDAAAADTAPYEVGSRLPRIELADQHGETRAVDEGVRFLLFSRDMEGGDVLREAVDDQDAASLARVRAVYLADIHRMPGLVARLIAVPRMRGRAYPMLLDRTGEATARLPDREGHATVIELDALALRAVDHLASPDEVRARLGLPAREDASATAGANAD